MEKKTFDRQIDRNRDRMKEKGRNGKKQIDKKKDRMKGKGKNIKK